LRDDLEKIMAYKIIVKPSLASKFGFNQVEIRHSEELLYYIISYHISYHIYISYHVISYHIISYHISHHVISYISYIISNHITSHHIIYYIVRYDKLY
jgi:hypothetical protein